ncbi:Crp/Fnr family transcriptional regulator [Lacibacter luteus]|uniref:Crp/Fnr family transcriptional regulator n=1 Tax=Lacibacter luteus TaxID=2508719 RepID=A0A4Q1CG39_9BACT|nr:Crp/Fnr family transcriptional regulator [Lacibacter luteus]RXK58877.1 Crp/Fnr family transcriptional regulator [Lacibacter luteus]
MTATSTSPAPLDILQHALKTIAGVDEEHFAMSYDFWQHKSFSKNEYYNEYKHVCKYLGFILDGVFRTYYIDEKGEEKNVFFFSQHQVVVSFQSFIQQAPCNYYTQSMTESQVLYIHINQLQELYKKSHQWERLGRLIAEMAFSISMRRTESFLFMSPEERYLQLVTDHPDIFNSIPLYQISSYLGIQGPSLSRIRKRISGR